VESFQKKRERKEIDDAKKGEGGMERKRKQVELCLIFYYSIILIDELLLFELWLLNDIC